MRLDWGRGGRTPGCALVLLAVAFFMPARSYTDTSFVIFHYAVHSYFNALSYLCGLSLHTEGFQKA